MIVVTSTARDAVGLAAKCVASVREASGMIGERVRHVFYAADEPTALDAATVGGAHLDLRLGLTSHQLYNLLEMWHECAPSDIIVHLDGDDILTPDALAHVAHMYEDPDVWLTYGSFVCDDGTPDWQWHGGFGRRYARGANPRHETWRASHLKTFRAGLLQRVHARPYLTDDRYGRLYTTCLDRAVMFPLLDLAGERYAVATAPLCVYHRGHGAGARGTDTEARDRAEIHVKPRAAPLLERPW